MPAGANDEENQKLVSIKSEVEKEVNKKDNRLGLIFKKIEKAMKDVESLALSVTNRIAAESSQVAANTPSVTKPGTVAPKPTPKPTTPTPKPSPTTPATVMWYFMVCDTHIDSYQVGLIYVYKEQFKAYRDEDVFELRKLGWDVRSWDMEIPAGVSPFDYYKPKAGERFFKMFSN